MMARFNGILILSPHELKKTKNVRVDPHLKKPSGSSHANSCAPVILIFNKLVKK